MALSGFLNSFMVAKEGVAKGVRQNIEEELDKEEEELDKEDGGEDASHSSVRVLLASKQKNKKNKVLKSEAGLASYKMSLGDDVEMEEAKAMVIKSFVGRVRGTKFSLDTLQKWLRQEILAKVHDILKLFNMDKGWIMLNFGLHEEAFHIANCVFSINSTLVLFKFQSPLFDANREHLDVLLYLGSNFGSYDLYVE